MNRNVVWLIAIGAVGCGGAGSAPGPGVPSTPSVDAAVSTASEAVASFPASDANAKVAAASKHLEVTPLQASPLCVVPRKIESISSGTRDSMVDAVSLDGAWLSTRVVSNGAMTIAVDSAIGTKVASTFPLDARALAWSFDGKRQVVVDGPRLMVKESDGTTRVIDDATPPAQTSIPGGRLASMSDDGRFLVVSDKPVVYDLADETRATIAEPPIAGGSNATYHIDQTGHFVMAENSRASFIGKLSRDPVAVTWTQSSKGAQQTPSGATSLEVPRMPFAQDWVPFFDVHAKTTVRLPITVTNKESFAVALCPGGNLVALIAKKKLGFYATDTGKLVFETPIRDLVSGHPDAFDETKDPRTLAFVDAGKALLVRSGNREVLLHLVP